MLDGDGANAFDVRFVLTARDVQTDALLPNVESVTTMAVGSEQTLNYRFPINEVFKLEVAAQDLRARGSDFGIFRMVTDVIVESKGVLEPAIGEVQELVFSQDILTTGAVGTIELFLENDSSNKVTMSLANFLGANDAHVHTVFKNAIVSLNDEVTASSQLRTVIAQKPEDGPDGGPAYAIEVIYSDPNFIGMDMPGLRVNLTIDPPGLLGPTVQTVLQNEYDVYVDSDGDGDADDINPNRMYHFFELRNRNIGDGSSQVWGQTRVVAGFDQSQTGVDIFDEVGGLGPASSNGIRDGIPDFSTDIAYDVFAIPVRGVALAEGVSVKLDPADVGDRVLIYGTATDKEEVPVDRINLGGNSRFLIDIHEPLPEVNADDATRDLVEDAAAITIDLQSLVTADAGTLTYELTSAATLGTATLGGTTLTYQPTTDAFGTETLAYRVTHESGQFDLGELTFVIAAAPDSPVAVANSVSTNEDLSLAITAASLLDNDTDADPGDVLSVVSITQPGNGTAVLAGGTITYNPAANYFGGDSLTYTIRDSSGRESTASILIAVDPINDSPTATGESARTEPNRPITFPFADLLANDSAGPLESDQTLTITAVGNPTRPGSTAAIVGETIVYTPATDLSAVDSFSYTVSDGSESVTATITVDVSFQLEPINLVLPADSPSDITIRRAGNQIEIVDHRNNDTLLLRRPLNTVTSLTITGATSAVNRVQVDHESGGLITFLNSSSSIDLLGGSSGGDELTVRGVSSASALLAEADSASTSMVDGLIATLIAGGSSSTTESTGFEKTTIENLTQVTIPSNSVLDVGAGELNLSSAQPVNLSRTTRLSGGTLTSTSPLALGANELLIGNGNVDAAILASGGSTITATGGLTLGDSSLGTAIDLSGVLNTAGHTVTLLDANEAVLRGRIHLGDGDSPGSVGSVTGLTVFPGAQITGHGTLSTPNNATLPLVNNGSIAGTSFADPITIAGWLTGPGGINNVSISGSWNPSDSVTDRLDGNVNLTGTSSTLVDIGGTTAGATFDRLRFNPGANLDGTLEVDLVNGFSPSVGHQFRIIEGTNTLTGEFDGVVLPTLTDGLKWFVVQSPTDLTLQVTLDSDALSDNVEVRLSATNQIIIIGSSGQDIPVAGDTLTLDVNPRTQRFSSPQAWTAGETENTDGRLVQIATKGSATLRIAGAGWTNFVNRFDVNRNGGVTAVDALVIINELNAPKFSSGETSELQDPNAVSEFPDVFYDTNGDGRVSAVDALQVINRLIEISGGGAEPIAAEPGNLALTIETLAQSDRGTERLPADPGIGSLDRASSLSPVSRVIDSVFVEWGVETPLVAGPSADAEPGDSLSESIELLSGPSAR